jgi:hypothetical protein
MRAHTLRIAAVALFSSTLLLSTHANGFVFHSAAAQCELYETGNAFTLSGTILSARSPGTGTVSLSCPLIETANFTRANVSSAIVDGFLSSDAGSFIKTKACIVTFAGGALHCGTEKTVTGFTGNTSIQLVSADLAGGWGSQFSTIDYSFLHVNISGVGTRMYGFELN